PRGGAGPADPGAVRAARALRPRGPAGAPRRRRRRHRHPRRVARRRRARALEQYRLAWDESVRLFGPNAVSTYLIVGLGEDPDELVAGAAELVDRGVYPFVVPYRPIPG